VPKELLQPGRPYTDFLRYLAEHGYYGEGDVEVLVAERVESLRNPSDKTFEDHTPDGRVHRIGRRRVAGGGTVTVITDITELKRTEEEVANKEAQLRIAMDNMPGAGSPGVHG
jgi:PAS domain-containing protein